MHQGNMLNHDYLQHFNNLVDVASTYNGQLYNTAIITIVTKKLHAGVASATLTAAQKKIVDAASNDMYLATMFIAQSDCL